MPAFVCSSCRAFSRRITKYVIPSLRTFTASAILYDENSPNHEAGITNPSTDERAPPKKTPINITDLLSYPSWSVRSLLPDPNIPPSQEITPVKLHHLLRLSALPQPTSPEEETKMLNTLHSQLHFVRNIQNVNTDGIEPLQTIRDETALGIQESTIGLEEMKEALGNEEVKGRAKRPRRKREVVELQDQVENWDVTGQAEDKVVTPGGTYFIVRSGKARRDLPIESKPESVVESGHDSSKEIP
jgi:Glu-tRNAGln amidotransferase C subunit